MAAKSKDGKAPIDESDDSDAMDLVDAFAERMLGLLKVNRAFVVLKLLSVLRLCSNTKIFDSNSSTCCAA